MGKRGPSKGSIYSNKRRLLNFRPASATARLRSAPTREDSNGSEVHSSSDSDDSDFELEEENIFADLAIDTLLEELSLDHQKQVAISIYFSQRARGERKMAALSSAAQVVQASEKTVRAWREDFVSNGGKFTEDGRGHWRRSSFLDDEDLLMEARKFVMNNSVKRGERNMTALDFRNFCNKEILPKLPKSDFRRKEISLSTAKRWLHQMGYAPNHFNKVQFTVVLRNP
eukprot:Pompholyxophrys_punicea_v1_NODE_595_length_1623_cov_2.719388.p1 type:complete len:228 gc:universal NODE_595_length_1623_cov_2.719388:1291-608(-)